MKDIMSMMKKAQELQAKMGQMQDEQQAEVTGAAAGGMVTVTLNGKGDMKAVHIDPGLLADGDVTMIEDLVLAAHADARQKAEAMAAEKMADMTAGLPLPPGMKFPF